MARPENNRTSTTYIALLVAILAAGGLLLAEAPFIAALGAAAISALLVHVVREAPPKHRQFGLGQSREAVDNHQGQFGNTYTDDALTPQAAAPSIGRNDACPCGSGRKFKRCHGA
ncbi:MAG: SEC-C metal-binding domain-containing protein [Vicinamibacterales bacterium]